MEKKTNKQAKREKKKCQNNIKVVAVMSCHLSLLFSCISEG